MLLVPLLDSIGTIVYLEFKPDLFQILFLSPWLVSLNEFVNQLSILREFGCFGEQIEDFKEEASIMFATSWFINLDDHVGRFLFLKNQLLNGSDSFAYDSTSLR